MNKPVNLNKFRKQRDKTEQKQTADENAVKFGRTKAEKILQATKTGHASKMLDQHLIEDDE